MSDARHSCVTVFVSAAVAVVHVMEQSTNNTIVAANMAIESRSLSTGNGCNE